jgi:hypothetical protein
MAIVRWIALAFGGLFVLVFLIGMFAPERPDRDVRIAASCHKEYREDPILVAQCVSAIRRMDETGEDRARARRAYEGSR